MDTIVAALITAATIAAALIGKNYAERDIQANTPSKPLRGSTTAIVKAFSFFDIRSARIIKLQKGKVHIDEGLGLVMVLDETYYRSINLRVNYFEGEPVIIHNMLLGSIWKLVVDEAQYFLILTEADYHSCQIQVLRKAMLDIGREEQLPDTNS